MDITTTKSPLSRRRVLHLMGATALLPLLPRPASALSPTVETAASPAPEIFTLENGTRLIVAHEPENPLAAVSVFFRVGTTDERGSLAGLLAVLSRSWIYDSQGRNTRLLYGDIDALGGNFGTNLAESGDYTEIWAVGKSDLGGFGGLCQTLLTDIVGQPLFTPEAVEAGRADVLRALATERDNLFDDALLTLRERVWDASLYSRSPLGTPQTVRRITAEALQQFYNRYFVPSRTTIAVVGGVRATEAKRMVRTYLNAGGFGERKPAPLVRDNAVERVAVSLADRARVLDRPAAPVALVITGFLAPGTRSIADYPALLLLDAVLGGGKGARLFRTLRDEQALGYEVRTLLQPGRVQSLMTGFVIGRMDDVAARDRVQKALSDALRSPLQTPVTELELNRAKAFLVAQYAQNRERLRDRARAFTYADGMGLEMEFEADYPARIRDVVLSDVARVAALVLSAPSATVVSVPNTVA